MIEFHQAWLKSLTSRVAAALAGRSKSGLAARRRAGQGGAIEALESRTLMSVTTSLAIQPLLPTVDRTQSYSPSVVAFGGSTYFLTGDSTRDAQLWKTDGTAAGTSLVKDLGVASYPDQLIASATSLFFDINSQLWKSDGTSGNTTAVSGGGSPSQLTLDNSGNVFFISGSTMKEYNGSSVATVVSAQYAGEGPSNPINVNGAIFFNEAVSPGPYQLFRYNSPNNITQITTQTYISSIGQAPGSKVAFGSKLYFPTYDFADGFTQHLYGINSDGTGMTTAGLTPNGDSVSSNPVMTTNGNIYFVASDSVGNSQIWVTNGTVGGTSRVTDINDPAGSSPDGASGLNPQEIYAVGNYVYIINADFGSSNPYGVGVLSASDNSVTVYNSAITNANSYSSVGNAFYFTATDADGNNGTVYQAIGAATPSSVVVGDASSYASGLVGAGSNLYFGSSTSDVPTDSGPTFTYLPMDVVNVAKAQGDNQTTNAGSTFSSQLQLKVTSTDNGTNLAGVSVTFVAPASGAGGTFAGGLTSATVTTDADGIATAPAFTANGNTGAYSVMAELGGESGFIAVDTGVTFSETNISAVPPTVTAVSPSSGTTLGGTSVTITGSDLGSASAVYFGGTAVTSFTSDSTNQIVLNAPAGAAGTVDITVITSGGTSLTSAADQFTFITPPSSNVSTSTLALGSNVQGTAGTTQIFTVSGSALLADLLVNAPAGVELSTDGTTFATSLDLTPTAGVVGTTTVYARVSAAAAMGSIDGNITVTSSGATEQDIAVSGTVLDYYSHIQLSATTGTFANDAAGGATLTVTRTGNLAIAATIDYTTADGTALAGVDYTATSGTLSFLAGESSKTITVPLSANAYGLASSTFTVSLSNVTGNGTIGGQSTSTITLNNSHSPITISSSTYTFANTLANATITVTRAGNTSLAASVDYATSDGTAVAGVDYTAVSGTLSFAAGESSKTITVPILSNAYGSATSTFGLTISNPAGDAVSGSQLTTLVTLQNSRSPVQIGSATYSMANDGGSVSVTVTRGGNLTSVAEVDYATADGTAVAGTDYTTEVGTVFFAAGETSKTISVPLIANAAGAATSTFTLTLSNPGGSAILGTTSETVVTVQNNRSLIQLASGTFSYFNTVGAQTITVNRTGNLSLPASIDYATADGTALAGSDYTAVSGTLTFGAGESSKTITIAPSANAAGLASSTFTLNLSNPTGSGVTGTLGSALITLQNTRSLVNIASSTYSADNDAGSVTITVNRTGNLATTGSIYYTTTDGTALAGVDYTTTSGMLTFAAGESSKTIVIPLLANASAAISSDFSLAISTNAPGNIVHPNTPPPIVIGTTNVTDVTLDNGHSNLQLDTATATVSNDAGTATFTVDRTGNISLPATVDYATADGTAVAGVDFTATSGTLSFAAGESSKTFTVALTANAAGAATSNFTVTLSNPTGSGVLASQVITTVTEQNNHSLIVLSSGTYTSSNTAANGLVTVTRTGNIALGATIDYVTADGTAVNGTDYTAVSGTVTFAPGESTETISIPMIANAGGAAASTFTLTLSNPQNSGVLGTLSSAVFTVANHRSLANLGAASNTVANDAGSVDVLVTRGGNTTIGGNVFYTTVNGTATAGVDYVATSGTLTFNAGETSKIVTIPLIANAAGSANSNFSLAISANSPTSVIQPNAPVNIVIGATSVETITLQNNHSLVQLANATYSLANDAGSVTVTVTRAGNTSLAGTVNYATADGTALAGTNYTAATGVITFAAGESSKTIVIPIIFAPSQPATSAFTLSISSPGQNAVLGERTSTTVTLTNSHSLLQFGAASYTVSTDDTTATITLTRSGNLSLPVSVNYATADGTALAGVDYSAISGVAHFDEGQATVTLTVPLLGNFSGAATSAFTLVLSTVTEGGVLPQSPLTVNITNAHTVIQLDSAFGEWDENYGLVNVTISRAGNVSIPATIDYATSDDTAIAGKNYTAVSGTLHFAAGQSKISFNVPYIQDLQIDPELFLKVTLTNPTAGMVLGQRGSEVLGITDQTPPPTISAVAPPATGASATAPVTSLALTFDQDLASPPQASDFTLATVKKENANGTSKTTPLPLTSVTYDPSTRQLTIVPSKALKKNVFYKLSATGSAAQNLNGQSLDGSGTGSAGSAYVSSFGSGRNLTYIDRDGNRVHLTLRGPGVIQLTRTADGQGQTLTVVGATSKTRLTGTVQRIRKGSTGSTTLTQISGLDSSSIVLHGAQFNVSSVKI